jgi:hypothetical protein
MSSETPIDQEPIAALPATARGITLYAVLVVVAAILFVMAI